MEKGKNGKRKRADVIKRDLTFWGEDNQQKKKKRNEFFKKKKKHFPAVGTNIKVRKKGRWDEKKKKVVKEESE